MYRLRRALKAAIQFKRLSLSFVVYSFAILRQYISSTMAFLMVIRIGYSKLGFIPHTGGNIPSLLAMAC